MNDQRYNLRGVSASKEDVHNAIKNIDKGIFPKAFCKIIPDILGGDPEYCNIMHADGAGTKSSLAYMYWKETGDLGVWRGIAQDALIMNIDDLLCVGATDNILVSSTIGRNKLLVPGEVISAIINGTEELLADEKERAEHNMLVDLGRNDLGKICDFGTVEVEKYMSIERYSHVMHIGSTVKGQLRKDKTAVDAIDSVLPAGTLSGAPKLRACQIINELENNKRGIYGGAIGYLDFTGNMDTCIAIRLAFKKNGKVFVRSGAGIVADSVPEKEHQECINKAKAVMVALAEAEGGSNL